MSVQFFRLWPRRPPDGSLPLGLSLDDEGLLLAGNCRLIEACLDRVGRLFYRTRSPAELSALLSTAYGQPVDTTAIHGAVERIAKLMTERNWSRARLAALHLRFPELADTSAAIRVLKTDALLKVSASFDPLKHPRWPKGSQAGHGGEFRPSDGGDFVRPVADQTPEFDPSRIQVHFHHWHDQSLTAEYEERGLLKPEAYDALMDGPLAKSPPIYQDVRNPDMRVHVFDQAHRAASAEVRQISQDFITKNGITAETPMTGAQARQLLFEIEKSDMPAITAYRNAILRYVDERGAIARQRFYRLPPIDLDR